MKKTIAIVLGFLFLLGVAYVGYQNHRDLNRVDSKALIEKLALPFIMYANESRGGNYPHANNSLGIADINSFLSEYAPNDSELAAYLKGEKGVELCYLGYSTLHETMALAVFECYEQNLIQLDEHDDMQPRIIEHLGLLGSNAEAERPSQSAARLCEGAERFFVDDIGNPSCSERVKTALPIIWEMPDKQDPPGGRVLYLDGHAEWLPYPGKFPMTRRIITKARALKGEPTSAQVSTCPYKWFNSPSPLYSDTPLGGILNTLNETHVPFRECAHYSQEIIHCKNEVEVRIGNISGYKIDSSQGSLAIFPSESGLDITKVAPLFTQEHEHWNKEFIGSGEGFDWFADAPSVVSNEIARRFFLKRDDILQRYEQLQENTYGHLRIIFVPDRLPEEFRETWLSDVQNQSVSNILRAMLLMNTPESIALLHEGLNPEHPSFFRNFRWSMNVPGIFDQYYEHLSMEQRIYLVKSLEWSWGGEGKIILDYAIDDHTVKLLAPYSVNVVMAELRRQLKDTPHEIEVMQRLEVYMKLSSHYPEDDISVLKFDEKVRLTYLRFKYLIGLKEKSDDPCYLSFLKGENYDRALMAIMNYPTEDKDGAALLKKIKDVLLKHPEALSTSCE